MGTVCPLPEQIYTEVMAQTELCGLMDRLLHWARIAEREGRLTDSKVFEVVLRRALERAYCCGRGRVASRDLESAARRLLPGGPLDASDDSPALD